MSPISFPKKWPITIGNVSKRQLTIIQKNEFKICQPVTREISEYLGFKKKTILIHLKADGEWNWKVIR